jgi:hypothetical protein
MRDDDRAAAPSFFCPLTMAVMKDPVQDREGTYEDTKQDVVSESASYGLRQTIHYFHYFA